MAHKTLEGHLHNFNIIAPLSSVCVGSRAPALCLSTSAGWQTRYSLPTHGRLNKEMVLRFIVFLMRHLYTMLLTIWAVYPQKGCDQSLIQYPVWAICATMCQTFNPNLWFDECKKDMPQSPSGQPPASDALHWLTTACTTPDMSNRMGWT